MNKTVTRWNQGVPEAHVSEGGKSRYSLLPSDSWGDMTQKVFAFLSKSRRQNWTRSLWLSAVIGQHMQRVKSFNSFYALLCFLVELYFLPLRYVLILGCTKKLEKLFFSEQKNYLAFAERISHPSNNIMVN